MKAETILIRKKFHCQRCGACCQGESTVSLTQEEIKRIANFLHLQVNEFQERFTVKKGDHRVEMKTVNGHCVFYEEKNKLCTIHPVKPRPCREWPFPPGIFRDFTNFQIIKESCPGLTNLSLTELKHLG